MTSRVQPPVYGVLFRDALGRLSPGWIMQLHECPIGTEFYTASGHWRCTKVGTRTIVATKQVPRAASGSDGMCVADTTCVFDEVDLVTCVRTYAEACAAFGDAFQLAYGASADALYKTATHTNQTARRSRAWASIAHVYKDAFRRLGDR